jgi:hypothetical protein
MMAAIGKDYLPALLLVAGLDARTLEHQARRVEGLCWRD